VCTLSWLPGPAGYALYFNRDERRTRAPALPPARREVGGVAYLAPTDGDFGGTWIGVNELGVAGAILNRYEESAAAKPGRVSRGLLLASTLGAATAGELIERLARVDLGDYAPFTLCAVGRGSAVLLVDWTGERIERSISAQAGLVRTSSGRDQLTADLTRRTVWHALVAEAGTVTADLLDRLHRGHEPERGPWSVCMHREEAETQSLAVIEVGRDAARLAYVPGPPCLGAPAQVATLPLVHAPA
jgi:uncharacterized protein with NRDE domain